MNRILFTGETVGNLNIRKFSHALDNPSQCYKFYWLEAILELLSETPDNLTIRFEDIIDRMISNAWYTVTTYHLHMGPGRMGNEYSDKVEEAIIRLNNVCFTLKDLSSKEEITEALHTNDYAVRSSKEELTKNVPYRLLSPFLTGIDDKKWNNNRKMAAVILEANQKEILPYIIIHSPKGLDRSIQLNSEWAEWMLKEYSILTDWIQYNKVLFLQAKNPGVPGIVYKLRPWTVRKLGDVRKLWKGVLQQKEFIDIYTGKPINDEKNDIDHFVPWSYVASYELWNLIPADKINNTKKSNRLPVWDTYANDYLGSQYELYEMIFGSSEIYSMFKKCEKYNLNSRWAQEQLYIPGHSDLEFKSILEKNMKQVYDAARNQGYDVWQY